MRKLSKEQHESIILTLKTRFKENMTRHVNQDWNNVLSKLEAYPEKLWSINEMEKTGGEPDVLQMDNDTEEYVFFDCSLQSPSGRRNVCYDHEAQEQREMKGVYPAGNVIDMAASMGVEVLTEEQYRELQKYGAFDTKTQSWIKTPSDIRKLGGAIFADRRYDHVFIYHNSAPSFYSSRGFRALIKV